MEKMKERPMNLIRIGKKRRKTKNKNSNFNIKEILENYWNISNHNKDK